MLLYGSGALELLARHWTGRELCVTDQPLFGRFLLESIGQYEEIVVHVANLYEIEIHSHGGEIIVSAIESALVQDGAISVSWQDFFCSGKTQQELALRLLPFAPTERTAQILLDQYNGAWNRERAETEKLENETKKQQRLNRWRENAELGKHLVQPFRVVLAGASNAGKSSLLNAILGFRRSLVNATAGTTRDIVSYQTALDGFPVTFYDTAGFRETKNELEQQGIERSLQSITDADLLVWVVDLTVREPEPPPAIIENILFCFNKIDLIDPAKQIVSENEMKVSAKTGQGIETLLERIIRRLVPNPPKPLEVVPLTVVPACNSSDVLF
jgi:tRNA modification GTPase